MEIKCQIEYYPCVSPIMSQKVGTCVDLDVNLRARLMFTYGVTSYDIERWTLKITKKEDDCCLGSVLIVLLPQDSYHTVDSKNNVLKRDDARTINYVVVEEKSMKLPVMRKSKISEKPSSGNSKDSSVKQEQLLDKQKVK